MSSDENEKPVVGRPFTKGVSGNPSGRPKKSEGVVKREHQRTEKGLNYLEDLLDNPKASEANKTKAAIYLVDRSLGKPKATVDVQGNVTHDISHHLAAIGRNEPILIPDDVVEVEAVEVSSDDKTKSRSDNEDGN